MTRIGRVLRWLSIGILVVSSAFTAPGAQTVARKAPARASYRIAPRQAAFLDTLERRTFNWFWERSDSVTGLSPDRWPTKSFSSVAAIGYALTAYPIGIERRYVTRVAGARRTLNTLRFLYNAPQSDRPVNVTGYRGFFYHFLDMETGSRFETVELSTIDTSLLLGGILFCQSYFTRQNPTETAIRAYADSIYLRVDWKWAAHTPPLVNMGWKPESGFIISDWHGYDEAMIVYILALGSPTHSIDPAAWTAWTSTYKWAPFYGQQHVNFPPLFGHQYSHVWVDFRGIQDKYMRGKGIDYFENSRRATYAQRAYAIANPNGWKGYGANIWGLTAGDGPFDTTFTIAGRSREFHSYWPRGAAAGEIRDDGTIGPTAAGGSIAFAPEIVVPALIAMRETYGAHVFSTYGFVDAFNPTLTAVTPKYGRLAPGAGWFDTDYLGIDQGPIIAMIENYRSGLVWTTMRRNPYVIAGLRKAGFRGGWLTR